MSGIDKWVIGLAEQTMAIDEAEIIRLHQRAEAAEHQLAAEREERARLIDGIGQKLTIARGERDAAIAAQREAEAQAAAMRAALQEHQRYWTDGFRWYCRYCGSEPVGIKESPVHKAACALSGIAGTALLARLARLETELVWYGDASNYDIAKWGWETPADVDSGQRAREALGKK